MCSDRAAMCSGRAVVCSGKAAGAFSSTAGGCVLRSGGECATVLEASGDRCAGPGGGTQQADLIAARRTEHSLPPRRQIPHLALNGSLVDFIADNL